MATSDSTRPSPKPVPVEAVYFAQEEDAPVIDHLIFAIDGVCSALDAEQPNYQDDEQMNRIANLSCAARILARQLQERMTTRPRTKRELEKGRKQRAEWLEARERLAGPAEGTA